MNKKQLIHITMTLTSVRFQLKRLLHRSGLVTATYLFTVNATKLQDELSWGALETITNVTQVFQLLVPKNRNCFEMRYQVKSTFCWFLTRDDCQNCVDTKSLVITFTYQRLSEFLELLCELCCR